MFISIIILLILGMCIKIFLEDANINCQLLQWSADRGKFNNNNSIILDIGGAREKYGIPSFAYGIGNQSAKNMSYDGDYTSGGEYGDGEGSGNFTNAPSQEQKKKDPRNLRDVMSSKCYDQCNNFSPDRIVEKTCNSLCGPNVSEGLYRTFGGNKIMYNDNMSDPLMKQSQFVDDTVIVPWSDIYNNIYPANPLMR